MKHFELEKYCLGTDIGIVLYKDTAMNYRFCAPNKLYEYWSYGIPVIGDQLPGLISVFNQIDLGILVDMEMPENILTAIQQISISDETKLKVKDYFEANYKLDYFLLQLTQKLESL